MALTKFKCKCIPIVIQQPVIKAWWKVAWQKQGLYFFEFFKFLDFLWLFPCPFLLFDDHRFSCHFLKLWKLLVTCFSIFLALKQFNRNKLWYPPKCVPFTLFNYSSLSCVILALSSAVTNLPNKTLIFRDFQGLTIKFHNFPGFLWPVRTPQEGVYSMNDFPCPLFLHFISHSPHSVVEK